MREQDPNAYEVLELEALRKFHKRVMSAQEELSRQLDELRVPEAISLPERVLVRRTPGPAVSVFHATEGTCKRVRSRDSYKEVSYRQAVDQGLTQCSACDWSGRS